MPLLFDSVKHLLNQTFAPRNESAEEYLAQAKDLAELELRMRQLDERSREAMVDGPYGLLMR